MNRRLATGALALFGLLAVGASAAVAEVKPAPDYQARLLGSEDEVSLRDLEGQVVMLNTWATWCDPCREEMPAFERLYQERRDDGLTVVGVSIDEGRVDGKVSSFVDELGVTFPIWRDPANRFQKAFRTRGVPETLLIDREGRIAHHWIGQIDPDAPDNRDRIEAALTGEPASAAAGGVATVGLLVAFGAGLVSVLSPCVLPLIPSYASVIAGVRMSGGADLQPGAAQAAGAPATAVKPKPAVLAGLTFVAGFSAVFIALGVLVNEAADVVDNKVWLSRVGGVILVVLGLHLLGLLRVRAADREVKLFSGLFSGKSGYVGVFFVGVAFAAGWSPCIGPVLGSILGMAALGSGSSSQAAILLAAYCAGLAIPFLAAALALDRFMGWSARMRTGWLPIAERVSGALVIAVGLLMVTGIFSRMAAWLAPAA